ncbi:MAG: signal peptidase II [Phycisphaerales bacterium]
MNDGVVSDRAVSGTSGGLRTAFESGTIRSGRAWGALVGTLVVGLATDLASKWAAFEWLAAAPVRVSRAEVLEATRLRLGLGSLIPQPPPKVTIVPSVLDLTLVLNPGAVFGMGAGKRWFFIAFTFGALLLAGWMFAAWTRPRDRLAHVAIALLVSGGLGNLYDRLVYGCVRDFLHPLPGLAFPSGVLGGREVWPYVSNLADLWLLVGIGLLMWFLWRGTPRGARG